MKSCTSVSTALSIKAWRGLFTKVQSRFENLSAYVTFFIHDKVTVIATTEY